MKKNYKSIKTFIVLLALMTMKMSAQLNGVYTIDQTSPASTSNYTSFVAFAASINALGVSGPVTVNVVASTGPYAEQAMINAITGSSPTNSVVINGNGNTMAYSSSSSTLPWTLCFNGTDNFTVNSLTITGTGSYAYPLMMCVGADNNFFNNCFFGVPANGTSSTQSPLVFSGATTGISASNSGNNNRFTGCTIFAGYYGLYHYGLTGSPYNLGNSFYNCDFTEAYVYGIYAYYAKNLTISGCRMTRPTRTNVTTWYGMYVYYNQGALIEKNRFYSMFDGNPGYTGQNMAAYLYYNPITGGGGTAVQTNTFASNIIEIKNYNNGYTYALYSIYWNGSIYHNTINIDLPTNNSASTTYGFYGYGSAGSYDMRFQNNIITMRMPTSNGAHYAFYNASVGGFTMTNNNIINYHSIAPNIVANNYHSYWNGAYANQTQLLTAGANAGGTMLDPQYMSPNTQALTNYLPTNSIMDNLGVNVGILQDNTNNVRGTVPDMGALEFLNTPCSGAPGLTSVLGPNGIQCPNVIANLGFASAYTVANIGVIWMSSTTSSVGPFTAIANATQQAYVTSPVTQNTWFTASVTCLNGNQSINATAGYVQIAGVTTNTAPYTEDFEGVLAPDRMPNCSWSVNNIATCRTYTSPQTGNRSARSGSKFASFSNSTPGVNNYYSNQIYMSAGVTYSASVWYKTEYYGYTNWTDLSLYVGPNQTTAATTLIASTNGPAASSSYKSLANTFTVPTSGYYYVNVRGTGSAGSAPWLTWDDLVIEIPCSINPVPLTASASSSIICAGQTVLLTAGGANTYTWNNNGNIVTTATMNVSPPSSTTYSVIGKSSLTGCTSVVGKFIQVNPAPIVSILPSSQSVCKGSAVTLNGVGAISYNWSTSQSGNAITVSPANTTTYTAIGVNQYGCQGTANQVITVNQLPSINIAATNVQMCVGETVTLSASPTGNNYIWNSNTNTIYGINAIVSPVSSITYSLNGTDANGCTSTQIQAIAVTACTGIGEITTANGVRVYPNPTKGEVNVEFLNDATKTIEVLDLTGRLVQSNSLSSKKANISLNNLANGIYYVKIQSNSTVEVVKVVKQ